MAPTAKCGKETIVIGYESSEHLGSLAGIDPKNPAVMSIDAFRNPKADAESDFAHAKDLASLQLLYKHLAQHPDDADAWVLRANCCYRESLWVDGVDSAQKSVDLQPQDIHKWRCLVQCQAALASGTHPSDPLVDPPTEYKVDDAGRLPAARGLKRSVPWAKTASAPGKCIPLLLLICSRATQITGWC